MNKTSNLEEKSLVSENVIGFPHGHDTPRPEPKTLSPAANILDLAAALIDGDRDVQHGNRYLCHSNIAKQWEAYLGVEITPVDVALMMALLKIARTKSGELNNDCFVDGCGYIALAGELAAK
jgi:hypothetical protein